MEVKELYTSMVGSHAWHMKRKNSDFDYWVIYQAPSRSFLLGNTHRGGHETKGVFDNGIKWDKSSFEIGQHIRDLIGGNINHVVCLLSPSVSPFNEKDPGIEHQEIKIYHNTIIKILGDGSRKEIPVPQEWMTAIKFNLRRIFIKNPSKNIYKSINGMSGHNINKYFVREHKSGKINPQFIPDTEENEPIRIKKLGQIQRIIEFGFQVLVDGIYDISPVNISNGSDGELSVVRQWREDLLHAYKASDLPEKPDNEPYEEFLIDLRMSMLER